MRSRFAFSQTVDGRLLVTVEALWGFPPGLTGRFFVSAIDDENTFIHHVVLANLAKEETIELIANVLLVVSGRPGSDRWVSVTLDPLQLTALGICMEQDETPELSEPQPRHSLGFVGEEDLARVFMKAPIAVCMMADKEHIFTFINPAFLKIIGRSYEDVLNKSAREALPELEGQQFFALLDRVYATGESFTGVGVPACISSAQNGVTREAYFDFVYHPVRNEQNEVCGILCQATDVTECVLEKHVRESREEQLYQRWAELEAIYSESPLGMCLIDAKTLRILRLNKVKEKLFGKTAEQAIGRRIGEISSTPNVERAYSSVIASGQATSFSVDIPFGGNQNDRRPYLWNLNPVFSANGEVEAIASTVMDIATWPRSLAEMLEEGQDSVALIQSGKV